MKSFITKYLLILIIFIPFLFLSCNVSAENILAGKRAIEIKEVYRYDNINNGISVFNGSDWNSTDTAIFKDENSYIIYDLEKEYTIQSVKIQGDNNDYYQILISTNNNNDWEILFTAKPHSYSGLQFRSGQNLNKSGRYIKIQAYGGDKLYSISEIGIFLTNSDNESNMKIISSLSNTIIIKGKMLLFCLATILLLIFTHKNSPKWWLVSLITISFIGFINLLTSIVEQWPPDQDQISFFRAIIAGITAIALIRIFMMNKKYIAHRLIINYVLGFMALFSFLAFYNLGYPQFYYSAKNKPTYIHSLDLRQYYPTAKYFDEIGYHDIYIADIAALLEDKPNISIKDLENINIRNLRTHQVQKVIDFKDNIAIIKKRFSPERWNEYKRDAGYIRDLIGEREYINYMIDYGGNATPVWISQAKILFNAFDISDNNLMAMALIDPILLIILFFLIWRVFGLQTMFISMIIFGANDFIMYGSNWGGAILRHDWLVYLGYGICALKTKKYFLGGAMIALSAMIRAFPIFALIGVGIILLSWIFEYFIENKKLPEIHLIYKNNIAIFNVFFGATIIIGILFFLSSLIVGFSSWSIWWEKVHLLQDEPHANHFGVKSLIAGWDINQAEILKSRIIYYYSLVIALIALITIAIQKKNIEIAAILGLLITWILYYPQNYYIHFIIFLPLLIDTSKSQAIEEMSIEKLLIWLSLLLLCVLQYYAVPIKDLGQHFFLSNIYLFGTVVSILLVMIKSRENLLMDKLDSI
ncbi:putative Discoidin domain-containing protein [Gammaproteobacteria bacterium]